MTMPGDDPAEAPPDSLPVGALLGDTYEIVRHIKRGGMADVYEAKNVHTGEPVALKVVLSEFARNEQFTAMFRKEGTVLSRLQNDAIVRYQVFTVDRETRRPYLVMEYIDGVTLSDVITDTPMAAGRVHQLMKRIATGLNAAHQLGVVHRDLKPDNILLPGGDVASAKIIDFGIAKAQIGGGTLVGSGFAGTYLFVSPEQLGLFGNVVTPRSDIYSLGLVLAAALLGKPIDMGGSHLDVIEKRRLVPDLSAVDPTMRPIIEGMLQPDPDHRPQTMAEVMSLPLAMVGAEPATETVFVAEDQWAVPPLARRDETVVQTGPPTPSIPPGRRDARPKSIPPSGPGDDNATRLIEMARLAQARTQELRAPGSTTVLSPGSRGAIQPVDPATLGGGDSPFGPDDAAASADSSRNVPETTRRTGSGMGTWVGLGAAVVLIAGGGFVALQSGLLGQLQGTAPPSQAVSDAVPEEAASPSSTAAQPLSALEPSDGPAPSAATEQPGPATASIEPTTPTADAEPTTPSSVESVAPAVSTEPEAPAVQPPTNLVAEAQPWVDAFAKDDCQFAYASVSANGSVSLREFTYEGTAIAGLASGFETWSGVAPNVSTYPVEVGQCAALWFLDQIKGTAVPGPQVLLESDVLGNGDTLAGRVAGAADWTTAVVLVDDGGNVLDATPRLAGEGSDRTFVFPVSVSDSASGRVPVLVLAISTKGAIEAAASLDRKEAWTTFRAILREINERSVPVAVSLAWFQVS